MSSGYDFYELKHSRTEFKGDIIGSQPRYGTRSLFLDMARNFHGAQTVFKLLDIMAMLEFNQLHLRLSDDEGIK